MSLADEDRQDWAENRNGLSPEPAWAAVDPTGTANERDRVCLIVDDNPTVRTLLGAVLKRRGLATLEAANAAEALAIVQSLKGCLNLVLTDIIMPGEMDGVDLAHAIRERFPTVPVILTSGYGDESKTLASGFPFVTKPFQSRAIWNVIEGVMAMGAEGSARTA